MTSDHGDITDTLLGSMLEADFIYQQGDSYGMTPEQRQAVRDLKDSDADDELDLVLIKALRAFLSALESKVTP